MARLGNYELEGEIGRGGMGCVYRARHLPTGALRAVKVLEGAGDPELAARFRREAEALARVGAGVAVPIHELGQDRGRCFFVMDLLAGGSLAERMKAAPTLPWRDAADLVARLARGVARCHALGIVHRDLKPANVLFDPGGAPLLADFGCVRDLAASTLTEAGTSLGTPGYMSPEQLDGERGDARADVYALGVILHELVAGARPHDGRTWRELLVAAQKGLERPIAAAARAPLALDRVLARALEPDPALRTPSAEALAHELEDLLAGKATATSTRALGAWLALASLVLVAATLLALAAGRDRGAPGAGGATPPPGPTPSPAPDGTRDTLLERLERGEVQGDELSTLAADSKRADLFERLAHDAVVLPLERLTAAEARSVVRCRPSLAVLEAVATITTASDARALGRVLGTLGKTPWDEKLTTPLRDAVAAVQRVLDQLERVSPQPIPLDALEPHLQNLADHPKLVVVTLAPLAKWSRDAVVALPIGGSSNPRVDEVGALLRATPSVHKVLEDVEPHVAEAYLAFLMKSCRSVPEQLETVPKKPLEAVAAKLESAGDDLVAAHAWSLVDRLMPETAPDLVEVRAKGRDRLERLLGPWLQSDERKTDRADERGDQRAYECSMARRLFWESQKIVAEATFGLGDELPASDPARRSDLEQALRLTEGVCTAASALNQDRRDQCEWASKVVQLRLALGRRCADKLGELDPHDPLRVFCKAGFTVEDALERSRESAISQDETRQWLIATARGVHSRAALLLGDTRASEEDELWLKRNDTATPMGLLRLAVERALPDKR